MLNRDEQVDRIIEAWAGRDHARGFIFTDRTTAIDLAMVALTALECGDAHPDRSDVLCDQLPHGQGHLYHRNSAFGLEWWASGARDTMTVHDVLGPIQLVQAPVRAGVEIRVPFIGGETKAGSRQEQHPGRYHTLPPCEDDPADAEDLTDVLAQAPAKCSAKHNRYNWYCDRDAHTVNPDDKSTWHSDASRDRHWYLAEEISGSIAGGTEADRAIYRNLLPILGNVEKFLGELGTRYRDGNPRMNAATCRTAETHRDELRDLAGVLQDLLDGPSADA